MAEPPPCTEDEAFILLDQLHEILDRDPLIDEMGFIHPTQILALSESVDAASPGSGPNGDAQRSAEVSPHDGLLDHNDSKKKHLAFWHGDHKLGISTHYLPPLYVAAKHRFMAALAKYRTSGDSFVQHKDRYNQEQGLSFGFSEIEMEVMRHSRALLLLCADFGTAWNSRKLIGTTKQAFPVLIEELRLSSLILSFAPKAECAWSHRRWVIKMIAGKCANLQDILAQESELVEKLAEKSKMNYRAWNHRSWLVTYMSKEQVLHELTKSRDWAGLHVADNSCFHYRRRLLLRLLDDATKEHDLIACSAELESLSGIWKEELDWNEILIRRYIGREALWLHRRFLSSCWSEQLVGHFSNSNNGDEKCIDTGSHLPKFMEHEMQLHQHCSRIPDSEFEDYTKQVVHSAAYILWLNKHVSERLKVWFLEKRQADDLKILRSLCPEKNLVWDYFLPN